MVATTPDGSVFDHTLTDRPETRSLPGSAFRWTHGLINRLVCLADVGALLALGSALLWVGPVTLLPPTQTAMLLVIETAGFAWALHVVGAYRLETYVRVQVSLVSVALGLLVAWTLGAGAVAAITAPSAVASWWFLTLHLT